VSRFSSGREFSHGEIPAVGVLLTNLGTPDRPTASALRRYLRQFLSDPRVVELPRPLWWLILNLFVLPFRPRRSARLYAKIWTSEGSPLLVITRRQAVALQDALRQSYGTPLHVALGMRYGAPSIARALRELRGKGCDRIVILPLYPQVASATVGSSFDAVAAELTGWRRMPALRFVAGYHDDPAYVGALAASITEAWQGERRPERILFSYHGIPKRTFLAGDPYHCACHATTRLVAERLGLPEGTALTTFQSRFGREEWLTPYTDQTLRELAASGVADVDVVCPGFAADCLETLEEIAMLNRDVFLAAGGNRYRYIAALNDRPAHIEALAGVCRRTLAGWAVPRDEWDAEAAEREAAAARARALRMGAER
jgi:ferrochelatase